MAAVYPQMPDNGRRKAVPTVKVNESLMRPFASAAKEFARQLEAGERNIGFNEAGVSGFSYQQE